MDKQSYQDKLVDLIFLKERNIPQTHKFSYKEVRDLFNEALILYHVGDLTKDQFEKIIKRLSTMHYGQEEEVYSDHDKHFYILLDNPFEADEVFLRYYFTIEILGIEISRHVIAPKTEEHTLWRERVEKYSKQLNIEEIKNKDEEFLKTKIKKILEDYQDGKFSEFFLNAVLKPIPRLYPVIWHDIETSDLSDLMLDIDELDYYLLSDLKDRPNKGVHALLQHLKWL